MTIVSAQARQGSGAAIAAIAVTVVLWASAFPGIRAALAAVPWLGELPAPLALAGGALTLAGAILVNAKGKLR